MSIAEATANAITTIGAGAWGIQGTDLFVGRMPDSPDLCICIYEYDGIPPAETMGAHLPVAETPRVQVVVRGTVEDYQTPRDRALAIRNGLAALGETTTAGITVMRWAPQGLVMPMGLDEKDRHKISVNVQTWYR